MLSVKNVKKQSQQKELKRRLWVRGDDALYPNKQLVKNNRPTKLVVFDWKTVFLHAGETLC
jgi:hypothetical protein